VVATPAGRNDTTRLQFKVAVVKSDNPILGKQLNETITRIWIAGKSNDTVRNNLIALVFKDQTVNG
jgi:hypothetical protein